ncbi:MAG: hypothetical protein ACM34H_09200 [Deltaproteobacteria bacterium]
MNDEPCIRVVGAFVALGAHIRMTPNRVHGRIVMVDAGDRFLPVALEAGDLGSDGVTVQALLRVAVFTLLKFEDPDPIVRIGKKCPPLAERP